MIWFLHFIHSPLSLQLFTLQFSSAIIERVETNFMRVEHRFRQLLSSFAEGVMLA